MTCFKGEKIMEAKDILWNCFQQTGSIGCYLLTKRLEEDTEYHSYEEGLDQEEQD